MTKAKEEEKEGEEETNNQLLIISGRLKGTDEIHPSFKDLILTA